MSAQAVPDVRAEIPRHRVPSGAEFCEAEAFSFPGAGGGMVVRELTAREFADWQEASEASGAGAMDQQIDFVGRCLCHDDLHSVGAERAGALPRTVMQRAAETALRLNGLAAADDASPEKKA